MLAALLVAACGTASSTPTAGEPQTPTASGAVVATSAPAPAPTVVAPVPTPEAEPAAPPAPNAEPATLRLALYGRCQHLGSSVVDGHTFLHYRHEPKGWVHRMDEHGAVAQTLPFLAPDDRGEGGTRTIDTVVGRWPQQLVLLETFHERADDFGFLHRWADGGWKPIASLDSDSSYQAAWPWYDGSILAWATVEKEISGVWHSLDRLAVVRGKPKAPSLAKLQHRASCKDESFHVGDVQVRGDRVTVLAYCHGSSSSSAWIGAWTAGKPEVDATRLPKGFLGGSLHLDDRGEGFVGDPSETDASLLRWSGGKATQVELPGKRLDAVIQVGDGRAWIVQGSSLSRWTGEGWEAMSIPEGPPIEQLAGLEHGTPWLLRKRGALSMQTADGSWHDVVVAATPDRPEPPVIDGVRVVAPGDAWVQAVYSITLPPKQGSKREKKQTMRAMYTTRDAPVPVQCGQEATNASASTDAGA
jgi:hypothetical protein